MKIVITGAAGFLGQKLATALLQVNSQLTFEELVLVDVHPVTSPRQDSRVRCLTADISNPEVANTLIDSKCIVIFHLAAIVSGHAESDFDIGMRVNFDATRQLLEAARRNVPTVKMVFTSTCGVFGGELPAIIRDDTAVTPENSYGMEKAMCELLINDYTRRGFVDGRIIRLPTITVRPGKPNKAVTSFVSGLVREPLNGKEAIIPVMEDLRVWVSSPRTVIKNILHTALIPTGSLGSWCTVNLPGITVTVKQMVEALNTVAGEKVASKIRFEADEIINKIIITFPTAFDTSRACRLGFVVDANYEDIIRAYIRDELNGVF